MMVFLAYSLFNSVQLGYNGRVVQLDFREEVLYA